MEQQTREWAIVTGASSGIGLELAKQFAENGFDLLVVAEDSGIHSVKEELEQWGTRVEAQQIDLSDYQGVESLYSNIKKAGRPIGAIAINAGIGVGGASFDKTDLEAELKVIRLNVDSVVHLTKRVLPDLLNAGKGRILFTSSVAAFMPGPYLSVYAASKAFVQSFAEAIREETADKGITVTALQPGPTDTNFFERAGMEDTQVGEMEKDDPAEVARQGFKALMEGRDSTITTSLKNKAQANMARMMPQKAAAKMHGKQTKPNSPQMQ
jgi:uncharacterized protein